MVMLRHQLSKLMFLQLQTILLFYCCMRNVVESNDFMSNIINGGGNGSGCRLVMEKNEWAAGCIPAVNFVVKLVSR